IHPGHMHSVARRACALDGIAETYRIQMHCVFDPEGPEKENIVTARHGFAKGVLRISFRIAGTSEDLPFVAHREDEVRGVVSQDPGSAGRERRRTQGRRAAGRRQITGVVVETLRGIDLAFETDDLLELRIGQCAFQLKMTAGCRSRLAPQADFAGVGHHVHRYKFSSFRIAVRGLAVLDNKTVDAKSSCGYVLQVGGRPRPAVHGYSRRRAVESVDRVVVAARRIAYYFNRELRLDDAS